MRLLFFLILLTFTFSARAQKSDTTVHVYMPNTFYTDYDGPYLTWAQRPVAFTLDVYDRWGELIFSEDKDPDFNFVELKERTFRENNVYIMVLKYTLSDGKSYQVTTQAMYVGFYCSG